jgi:hypothetical protein
MPASASTSRRFAPPKAFFARWPARALITRRFHQTLSPDGKIFNVFRIGDPNVTNKESLVSSDSQVAKALQNDLPVGASPRSGSARVVHVALPSGRARALHV